jgi:DNA-binding transcriptional LysR family regulator
MGCIVFVHQTLYLDEAPMSLPDLNLLVTLDALLAEGSVAGAAQRLQLSPSAMSRALARLRETTGDPLLVRAGRGLVPTPRALQLREQVRELVQSAEAVLRPVQQVNLLQLKRTFTLRNSEGFVENFGAALLARLRREAPGVRLRFRPKLDKHSTLLRDGEVDLETTVVGQEASPELITQRLFQDRFIGVVRAGHPLGTGTISAARYVAAQHVQVARRSHKVAVVDEVLQQMGLARDIPAMVGGFASALALARSSDLVATVPERHSGVLRDGMYSFELPLTVPEFSVAMLWHPRQDADPAHRWLRACVREVCQAD